MDTKQATVNGRLTCDETGNGIAGAEVRVGLADDNHKYVTINHLVSDEEGNYSTDVSWTLPEKPRLFVEARGATHCPCFWPWPGLKEFDSDAGLISDGEDRTVDLELGPGFSLRISVSDPDREPIHGARLMPIRTSKVGGYCGWPMQYRIKDKETEPHIDTDETGNVVIAGMHSKLSLGERWVISVQHPDYAECLVQSPEDLPRTDGVADVRVTLETGCSFNGRVVTEDGEVLEGADVRAVLRDDSGRVPCCHSVKKEATSDANGNVTITALEPGIYDLSASHPGWRDVRIECVELPTKDPISLKLISGDRVSGTILGTDGNPVSGANVKIDWSKPKRGWHRVTSDEDGGFNFNGIPKGSPYTVVAHAEDDMCLGILHATGSRTEIVFDHRDHVTVTGRFIHPDTLKPISSRVHARLWSAKSNCHLGRWHEKREDGSFVLTVPPCKASLLIDNAWEHYHQQRISLKPGQNVDLGEIVAQPGNELKVHVVNAVTGEPLNSAMVTIDPCRSWGRFYHRDIKKDGTVAFDQFPPDYARLKVSSPGYQDAYCRRFNVTNGMVKRVKIYPEGVRVSRWRRFINRWL